MQLLSLALALSPVLAGVVTVERVTTPQAVLHTTTVIGEQKAITIPLTATAATTVYTATTTPLTTPTGTVVRTLATTKADPVTQIPTYQTTQLATPVNPSTFTKPVTVLTAIIATTATFTTQTAEKAATTSTSSTKKTSSTPQSQPTAEAQEAPAVSAVPNYYPDSDIFGAVSLSAPPNMFPRRDITCPVPNGVSTLLPAQTNKFYTNLFLGTQQQSVFAQPYTMWYAPDNQWWGFGVSYTQASQRVFGPDPNSNPARYYLNPLMLKSFVFSANEFTTPSAMSLNVDGQTHLSVNTSLVGAGGRIDIPISIGMGMATAVYTNLTPRLYSQIGFKQIVKYSNVFSNVQKYRIDLQDGTHWVVYVTDPSGSFTWKINSGNDMVGNSKPNGLVVQLAINPNGMYDSVMDLAAGMYPSTATIDANVQNDVGYYRLNYQSAGTSSTGRMLLYALPHHVSSFTPATGACSLGFTAYSRTKGYLTAVLANTLEMQETLDTALQWLPYQPGKSLTWSTGALQKIASVINSDISQDMVGPTTTTSTYTAGKILDKFAFIVLTASEILKSPSLSQQGLASLKEAIAPWLSNTQLTPFIYDTRFKGVTSSADPNDDYGAPYYNDHHFHYGYYVHAAAVIGLVDKKLGGNWAEENKDWVNSLIRDVANPSSSDTYFPVFRMFDFYHGHSWAAGLFESADGKNEESSSEDYHFAYAMKLWGQVIGDKSMEARGDLMLAIMKRSLALYYLYENNNNVEPAQIIPNRVPGILYENKIDHVTFFGTNPEYIQGIQMIPMTGATGLIRSQEFVRQEWTSLISTFLNSVNSGWTGILRSNQALFDPITSYVFFSQNNFPSQWLDNGASLTWYIAFAAGLSGI
ncbi:Endo-1,3(4)-beta-glucanase 1 [Wickerhamiella sorbophila]|uniref:glucan endo-1,3-beta-D-glucosidase n=1 Tax=Wickerhamiella sorbophila TaxID=45607 RepID=A0A2T0FLW1_9ASCO|nr:Endo-1,3(4)-beta-glucanase 1 [Wickerhamiella sorbophila]PRT55983.1 Endo-1,3(4)-beta-glucanase 1 [Wickerhamiella sorbophila]